VLLNGAGAVSRSAGVIVLDPVLEPWRNAAKR
jgi:hypothetical protein